MATKENATAKKEKSTFGFGTTEQLYEMGYPIIKHSTFPFQLKKIDLKIIISENNRCISVYLYKEN